VCTDIWFSVIAQLLVLVEVEVRMGALVRAATIAALLASNIAQAQQFDVAVYGM
jgi:hypothetical protein